MSNVPEGSGRRKHLVRMKVKKYRRISKDETPKVLKELYDILEIDNETREFCKRLNYIPFPNKDELKTDDKGVIIEGSYEQLLLALTDKELGSLPFQKAFVITTPSFSKPNNVFAAMYTRFFVDPKKQDCNVEAEKVKYLQMSIINIFNKGWAQNAIYAFKEPKIMKAFEVFMESDEVEASYKRILHGVYDQIKMLSKTELRKPSQYDLILPMKNDWDLMDLDPVEFARQLVYYHSLQYQQIIYNVSDLVSGVFGSKSGLKAEKLEVMTKSFDDFASYVSWTIMTGAKDAHTRGRIFKKWVDIAIICLNGEGKEDIHNDLLDFHGAYAITCGLTHRCVARLKDTIKYAMRTNKIRKAAYQRLTTICELTNDYKAYRAEVQRFPSCIPFMGCFQKDLVYIAEFYPNKIGDLINFTKCTMTLDLIENLRSKFMAPDIIPNERAQRLLREIPPGKSTIELMTKSLEIEKAK